MFKKIPLNQTFTVLSLIFFIFSVFLTLFGRLPKDFGFLFVFMSTIFIISSMVSALPPKEDL